MVMITAEQIKLIREAMGLSLTDFAAVLGVSISTVCLWEQGHRHPRWKPMVKLNDLAKKYKVKLLVVA